MNPRTKKFLTASSALLILAVAGLLFFLIQIKEKGALLGTYTTALAEQNSQEASFIRIRRQVESTVDDRASIRESFFKDESDSIAFLGAIESFASSINLKLETQGLNKITRTSPEGEFISMNFVYSGTKAEVLQFTELLENIPYHSWLESLQLVGESDEWEGAVTLLISIKAP